MLAEGPTVFNPCLKLHGNPIPFAHEVILRGEAFLTARTQAKKRLATVTSIKDINNKKDYGLPSHRRCGCLSPPWSPFPSSAHSRTATASTGKSCQPCASGPGNGVDLLQSPLSDVALLQRLPPLIDVALLHCYSACPPYRCSTVTAPAPLIEVALLQRLPPL